MIYEWPRYLKNGICWWYIHFYGVTSPKIDSQNHRKINSSALQGFALILKTAFFKLETISHSVAAKAKTEKISVQDSSMLITPSSFPPPRRVFIFFNLFFNVSPGSRSFSHHSDLQKHLDHAFWSPALWAKNGRDFRSIKWNGNTNKLLDNADQKNSFVFIFIIETATFQMFDSRAVRVKIRRRGFPSVRRVWA